MKFPYQREESSLFGEIYRPIAKLEVETQAGWITLLAYVDSGADISILPASFLKAFGVVVEEEEIKEVRGIGGTKIPVGKYGNYLFLSHKWAYVAQIY